MLVKPTEKPECKYFDMSVITVLKRRSRKTNHIREVLLLGAERKTVDVSNIAVYQANC